MTNTFLKRVCLIAALCLLLLAGCAARGDVETTAPETLEPTVPETLEVTAETVPEKTVLVGTAEIPEEATYLTLSWQGAGVSLHWAGEGPEIRGDCNVPALTPEQLEALTAFPRLNSLVLAWEDGTPLETQTAALAAAVKIPALESLFLDGSTAPLLPLADCAGLRKLHFVDADLSTLPGLNIQELYVTDCDGMDWSRLGDFPALEVLGAYDDGMPATLTEITGHPTLRTLYLELSDDDLGDDFNGELPVVLAGPEAQIPAGVALPYPEQELLAFAGQENGRVILQLNTFE